MTSVAAAAYTAAILSFLSACLSIVAARSAANIGARRHLLHSDFKDISRLLWSVVAYSVQATNARSEENFDEKINKGNRAAEKLDILRIEHRITLNPMFEAIGHLNRAPIYVKNLRKERRSLRNEKVIAKATNLRRSLDKSLYQIYLKGRPPSLLLQLRLKWDSFQLRRAFEANRA